MADPIEKILRELDQPVEPRPEFGPRLLDQLLDSLGATTSVAVPPRPRFPFLRELVAAAALLVFVTGLAIAFSVVRSGRQPPLHHNGQIVLGLGQSLVAIDPTTGVQHPILSRQTDATVSELSDPAYSPDGSRLAYITGPAGSVGEPAIWVLNTRSGRTQLLATCHAPGCGRFSQLSWSPDGSRLAYSDGDLSGGVQLYLIDVDGTHRMQLTNFPSSQNATQPSWSPSGTQIAFTLSTGRFGQTMDCGYDCEQLAPPTNIDVINTDGSGLTVLLANVKQQNGIGNLDPTWSPDGSRIAYVVNLPLIGPLSAREQLWLMDPDGSHRTKIFVATSCCDQGGPAWSPDGTRIAFVAIPTHCSLGCVSDLYVMKADGSKPRDLGGVGFGDRPTWQPVP